MCRKCKEVITDLQMNKSLAKGVSPCPCGSLHFQPTNPPPRWWLTPSFVWYGFLRLTRIVA
jgi:NAD-dependent SIR2 family protein deacetylase